MGLAGATGAWPDALHHVRRTALHELVVERVLSHIVQHDLVSGDRIPSERELARRLSVSRTSVRQAIALLVDTGVLSSRQGDGTFVATLDHSGGPLAAVAARRARLADVHEARRILEVPAAMLAAERRDEEDLEAIARALELMASEVAAGEVGSRGDAAFHAAVTAAAHNPTLGELMARIDADVAETRSESLSQDGRPPRSLEDHRAIARAIAERDAVAAGEAMRAHLGHVADVRLMGWSPR